MNIEKIIVKYIVGKKVCLCMCLFILVKREKVFEEIIQLLNYSDDFYSIFVIL